MRSANCRRKQALRAAGMRGALRLVLLGAILGLAACAAAPPADEHVTLLAFNDFHGRLEPPDGGVPMLLPDGRVATVGAGGAAYLAGLIHRLQATRPNTLVVAAGDLVGASPLASAAFHDEPSIDALGLMGLQVSAVGNHEFDRGRDELLRKQSGGCAPPVPGRAGSGVVDGDTCLDGVRFPGARFQYLAANVVDTATGATLLPATALLTAGQARVGFIGLPLAGAPAIVTPAGVAGLQFLPEADTINRLVPGLRQAGANAIVVLIHQGGETTATHADDGSCPGFAGEILAIADALDPAVDVVISAHTHQEYVCRRPNGRLVTSAGAYGRYLTEIDVTIDRHSGRVKGSTARTHVVANGLPVRAADGTVFPLPAGVDTVAPDPAVQALVQRVASRTETLRSMSVGQARWPLTRVPSAAGESSLGDAVADAYLRATTSAGAVLAFTNPGGLRADVTPDPSTGQLRYGQLYTALPFGNTLVTMDLTGAQLEALLAQQWQSSDVRMLQVSAGFAYRWQAAAGGLGGRVVPGSLRLGGTPVLPDASYRVTVNSYMASGGDGFSVFVAGTHRVEGPVDLHAMVAHVRSGALAEAGPGSVPRIERSP